MTFFQGVAVFLLISVGIVVWAFCSAEEMEDHD